MLTVVVPFCNGHKTLGRLLDSLPSEVPVVVVDDHSDAPLQLKRENVTVICPPEKGYFSGAVNTGIQASKGDVLVLNQDVWLEGDAWRAFVAKAQAGRYAIAGDGVMGHPAWPKGYVQGTFMFLSRAAIDKVGLLNEVDYPLWGATAEWQLRACRLGFRALPIEPVPGLNHERKAGQRFGSSISRLLQQEPEKQEWYIRTPPAVSIIVACYNQGRYLTDAIHSLVGGHTSLGHFEPQSFQSFEIIIVDDASTDETQEVAAGLADGWKAIRYIRNPKRLGTPAAYNVGIRAAHGKFITLVAADDMRESWALEAMYRLQEASPHAMIYDDMRWFAEGKREVYSPLLKKTISHFKLPNYNFDTLIESNQAHAGIMFPRQAWIETGGYPEIMTEGREDWAFNIALGIKGYCGIHLPRAGYLYRREGQGKSMGNQSPEMREFFMGQLKSLFPTIYKGERPMGCCGRGKSTPSNGNGARSMATLSEPVAGMELLEYQGGNYAKTPYYGPVTKTRYLFSKKEPRKYVRSEDVDGMLQWADGGKVLFKRVTVQPVAAPMSPPVLEEAEQDSTMTAGPEAVAVDDPSTMTVADLESYAEGKTPEQLAALLDAEEAGKSRKGAIDLLKKALYSDA